MAKLAAGLLVILVLAAGCAETSDAPPSETLASSESSDAAAPAPVDLGVAPTWAVGDWWTYDIEYPNSGDSGRTTIVVYREDANNWYLATDTRRSGELAEFSHYPTLGAWTKKDLSPTIHDALVPFFKFPLTDGKSWTDPYRGTAASWTATKDGNGFELEAVIDDGQTLTYGYDQAVGFFTHLEYGFGVPTTLMTLVANGHNYTGTVSVLTYVEHVHGPHAVLGPASVPPSGTVAPTAVDFTVGDADVLLWGFYYGGAPGAYEFTLNPREGSETEGVEQHQQSTDDAARFLWGELVDPRTGSWGLLAAGASTGSGFVFAEALEVREEILTLG